MKLLYYSPVSQGGLANYAHSQAGALAEAGAELIFLCAKRACSKPRASVFEPILTEPDDYPKLPRRLRLACSLLANARALELAIDRFGCSHVLWGSYYEYLAPFWAWRFQRLARSGVVFGAVVHDPVRDFVVGPPWWHRQSVALAYSFLREAFLHEEIQLDTVRPMPRLRSTVIPHGSFPAPKPAGADLRAQLDIPRTARVLLAFGHIRDGKNLHLALEAMRVHPEVYLIVAGDVQTANQKPVSWYRALAEEMGVAGRCRWLTRYIEPAEIGDLFNAADLVLLSYSREFRSASGVLNLAVSYRKPCIASAGEGNLKSVVLQYRLGVWVEPDDAPALAAGMAAALHTELRPEWDRYETENSWQHNAELVLARLGETA